MSKTLADILRSYIPDGDGYNSEYAHNLNAAADALESQQSAPAGYVMVPVDMTQEMYLVFCEERGKHGGTFRSAYKAMLSAAPKAEQPPVPEPVGYVKYNSPIKGHTEFFLHEKWCEDGLSDGWIPLYAAPQPVSDDARDAARWRFYREGFTDPAKHDAIVDAAMGRNGE